MKRTTSTLASAALVWTVANVGPSSHNLWVGAQSTTTNCPATTLAFQDEFNGSTLDTSLWTPQIGNGCDQGPNLCGWGNNEAQYYRSENLQVSNGTLKIMAQKEDYLGSGFTSGRIRSLNQVEIDLTKPTYIEAKIQVPSGGQGLWPAFWMLPTPIVTWPTGGEIDIMEFIGREPFYGQGYLHYGAAFGDKGAQGGPMRFPEPLYERFHTFGLLKTTNRLAFFIDGFEFQAYTPSNVEPKYSWPFENTFHFILNVAVGGFWPGYPDDNTVFPTSMQIDYLRVYNITDDTTAVTAFPTITGNRLLHSGTTQEEYCVQNAPSDASIVWQVPPNATFASSSSSTSGTCILVDFGSVSGYVQAVVTSSCATDGTFSLSVPIEVQPLYAVVSTIWDDTIPADFAKGTLVSTVMDDGISAWEYTRNSTDLFDHIQIDLASAVLNPDDFLAGQKKFFLDVKTTTSAPCTQIMMQLEDQAQSVPDNYPVGRHSRFQCLLEPTREWQRVGCEWIDQPDPSVTTTDRVVLLIDPTLARSDRYYFRTVDIAAAGCTTTSADCESLPSNGASTSNCRRAGKSEAGACSDGGFNNDWEGYNGNLVSDCDDPACYMIDPICGGPPESAPAMPNTTPSPGDDASTSPLSSPVATAPSPSPQAEVIPPAMFFDGPTECSLNEGCIGLEGDCCPNSDGIFLWCCFEVLPVSGYEKDFTLIGPDGDNDQATYMVSTAPYVVPATAPDDSFPVISYQRNPSEEFDLIYYETSAISNAREYVDGTRKFYMDVYRTGTSDSCTRVLLQLDSTPLTDTAPAFPIGRHSRYVAFVTISDAWERVEFVFLDQPDFSVDDAGVTAVALFFDPGSLGNDDSFFFRNLDSAESGCTSSSGCEEMIPKSCPAFFSGEGGSDEICSDGEDNDLDGLVDCADTDCMLEPTCGTTISRSYGSASFLLESQSKKSKSSALLPAGRSLMLAIATVWIVGFQFW